MRPRYFASLAGAILVLGGVTWGRSQERQNWGDYLPPGEARTLVVQQCSPCHDLRGTVQQRQPRDWWELTVYDMVARGAPIFLEEADEIIDYLSRVFGPDAPPLIDVNVASREELLKLPGLTADLADKVIAHRTEGGGIRSRDQLREILGVSESSFQRIQYYIRASIDAGGQ